MTKEEILAQIKTLVSEQLGVSEDKVVPAAHYINDLGADSLGSVELFMSIEEAFDLDIPDEEAEKLRTVGETLVYIEDHLND